MKAQLAGFSTASVAVAFEGRGVAGTGPRSVAVAQVDAHHDAKAEPAGDAAALSKYSPGSPRFDWYWAQV